MDYFLKNEKIKKINLKFKSFGIKSFFSGWNFQFTEHERLRWSWGDKNSRDYFPDPNHLQLRLLQLVFASNEPSFSFGNANFQNGEVFDRK